MSTTPKPSNSNGVHKSKPIGQRIRDTKRLLAKTDLAETIRNGQERILAALILEQEEKKTGGKEKKHQSYYRKIKFIERVKLMRRLEAAEKKLSKHEDGPERQAVKELVIDAQRKLKYIEQFPRTENYISIIKEDAEMDEGSRTKRAQILESITVDSLTSNPIKQFTLKKKIKKKVKTDTESTAEAVEVNATKSVIASDDFFSSATKEASPETDSAKKSKKDKKEKKSKKEAKEKKSKKEKKEKKESGKSKQQDTMDTEDTPSTDIAEVESDDKVDKKKSKKSKKDKKDTPAVTADDVETTPKKSKRKSMLSCDTPRPSTKKIKLKKSVKSSE
eukprot:m.107524 g.107524  ORF g.107524 m.107524 type:complete len:333 (-) comp27804_c1_seq1:209-1207(-)